MAFSRRSFLRAAALSVGAIGLGGTAASATGLASLPISAPDALSRVVAFPRTEAHRRALSHFDDTHAVIDGGVELLLWPGDLARLQATGMPYRLDVADVLAHERSMAEAAKVAPDARLADIPGGITEYRTLDQIHAELDQLAADAAESADLHVEVVTLPHASFEGRTIKAVEISVGDPGDGRGVSYIDGCHHAREWPAAELSLIFAHYLVEQALDGDQRVLDLLGKVAVRICPVINVDGFAYSRGWADTPLDNPNLGIVAGGQGAYVRKTQRNNPLMTTGVDSEVFYGVDPNRNYAYLWGGTTGSIVNGVDAPIFASTSSNPLDQTYYGTEPFSEPCTRNNQEYFLSTNVLTYLSNHTQGRLILRPWGHTTEECPDADLLIDLGARMSAATAHDGFGGYESKIGLGLYPTLGTSNDWAYAATGTLGYVIENSLGEFHPPYGSLHGPGNTWPYVVEMFMLSCEEAALPRSHSILTGKVRDADGAEVPATLTLTKTFQTPFADLETYQGTGQYTAMAQALEETIELTLSTDGSFGWHVNPSTRPIAEIGGAEEAYVLTATTADGKTGTTQVVVARGEQVDASVTVT